MTYRIVPIAEEHISGFHAAVDVVARERQYLAHLEAPPSEETRRFVLRNIERGYPQFAVVSAEAVVGWCDILPNRSRVIYSHCGTLGVGLLPEFRGKGIGRQLMLSQTVGIASGALLLHAVLALRGGGTLTAPDFYPAFIGVAMISLLSVPFFLRMPPDAGAEVSGRVAAR